MTIAKIEHTTIHFCEYYLVPNRKAITEKRQHLYQCLRFDLISIEISVGCLLSVMAISLTFDLSVH